MSCGSGHPVVPATILGGGTNLAEYRALLQVLSYASLNQRDAVGVVADAWTGGVVSAFDDQFGRTTSPVLLPSSKSVALLAPLIVEGFFAPSLSFTLDNPFGTPYQPLTESNGRDGFTLVNVLFPDCFLDVSAEVGRRFASASTDRQGAGTTSVDRRANTRTQSPQPSHPGSRSTTPPTSLAQQAATSPALLGLLASVVLPTDAGSGDTVDEQATSTFANTVSLSTWQSAFDGQHALVDLAELHRSRLAIALAYLFMVNDTLHDVQMRELTLHKKGPSGPAAEKEGAAVKKAELANVRAVGNMMEKLKALLLSCICASEMFYRALAVATPAAEKATPDANVATTPSTSNGLTGSAAAPRSPSPVAVLASFSAGIMFFTPVEEWSVWCQSPSESGAWYDQHLESVLREFEKATGEDLRTFLDSVRASTSRSFPTPVRRKPELLLHRATDGHGGVVLELVSSTCCRPVLPHMPVQPGELAYFHTARPGGLLLDAEPSLLMSTLTQWTQRKLTDPQVRQESIKFFGDATSSSPGAAPAWAALSPVTQSIVREGFLANDGMLASALQFNPVLLARVVMWLDGKYGSAYPRESEKAADGAGESRRAIEHILLHQPFSVGTGYFIRELVSRRALAEHSFTAWLAKTLHDFQRQETGSPPLAKTVPALADFVLASTRWTLDTSLREALDALKKNR